jgi:hypothetical protein
MSFHTYLAGSTGLSSADAELLDRLRLMQERLDRWLEPAAEAPEPASSAVSADSAIAPGVAPTIDSGIGSAVDPDLRRACRPAIWRVTAGRIGWRRRERRRQARQAPLPPPAAGTGAAF